MSNTTYYVRDGQGNLKEVRAQDIGAGVLLLQSVSSAPDGTPYSASNPMPLQVPNYAARIESNAIAAVGGGTAYAHGDLIADSSTAGSVTPFSFADAALVAGGQGRIERIQVIKGGTTLTNMSFRVHFFSAAPASLANGDNGAFSCSKAGYIGAADATVDRAFTDGAVGTGLSLTFTPITFDLPSGTTLYALLEARPGTGNTLTLGAGESLQLAIEVYRFFG